MLISLSLSLSPQRGPGGGGAPDGLQGREWPRLRRRGAGHHFCMTPHSVLLLLRFSPFLSSSLLHHCIIARYVNAMPSPSLCDEPARLRAFRVSYCHLAGDPGTTRRLRLLQRAMRTPISQPLISSPNNSHLNRKEKEKYIPHIQDRPLALRYLLDGLLGRISQSPYPSHKPPLIHSFCQPIILGSEAWK